VRRLRAAAVLGLLCLAATVPGARAQAPDDEIAAPLHVLFLGNSLTYTNDLPFVFRDLAQTAGKSRPFVRAVTAPGYSLEDLWNQGDAQKVISGGGWDFVVMQQGPSASPDGVTVLRAYSERFAKAIRAVGGRPVLYMVWPSTSRPQDFDGVMQAYAGAAKSVGGLLCPAGAAWRAAAKKDPKLALYSPDGLHPTFAGTYLAALTFYGLLYAQSPVGLPAGGIPPGAAGELTPARVRVLQESAAAALAEWSR
jgi:hypothetical protein